MKNELQRGHPGKKLQAELHLLVDPYLLPPQLTTSQTTNTDEATAALKSTSKKMFTVTCSANGCPLQNVEWVSEQNNEHTHLALTLYKDENKGNIWPKNISERFGLF